MAQTALEKYRRWFEYEKESHAKVLASLNSVPEESRSSEAFEKALSLMAHLVEARRLWLYRFGILKEGVSDFFPRNVSLIQLSARADETQASWDKYLDELTEAELSRVFEYQSMEGGRYRNTIEDILTQLFGHSLYHRGQIAMLLRSIGAEPAVTDFVYWTRELIEPEA